MKPSASAARGFVLIAALAVVMIGAIWAASAARRLTASVNGAVTLEREARSRAIAEDGLASSIFMLVTAPRLPCGVQPEAELIESEFLAPETDKQAPCVWLDDRNLKVGAAELRLQDGRALYSVRAPNVAFNAFAQPFMRTLDLFLPAETLADYGDIDDRAFIKGAEGFEYRFREAAPPPNRWPRTPYEAFDALGWESLARPEIANMLGMARTDDFNYNTASLAVMSTIPEVGDITAQTIVEGRGPYGYNTHGDMLERLRQPFALDSFKTSFITSDTTRVRASAANDPLMLEASVAVESPETGRLWSFDYIMTAPNILREGNNEFKPTLTLSAIGVSSDVERVGPGQ